MFCNRVAPRAERALLAALCALAAFTSPVAESAAAGPDTAVLVRLAPGADTAKVLKRAGVTADRRVALPGAVRVRPGRGSSIEQAMGALRAQAGVVSVDVDRKAQLAALPKELNRRLWGLNRIAVATAWMQTLGSDDVTVAVVDTGVDFTHKDLAAGQWTNAGETGNGREANGVDDDGNGFVDDWRGWDFAGDDADPDDSSWHGTHVAGTVGARANGIGIVGVAPRTRVMSLRACDPTGCWESDMAAAFRYATRMGARVVNVSIITPLRDLPMLDAVRSAPDTLFVAAAGNRSLNLDAPGNDAYPCEFTHEVANMTCVAATNDGDYLSSFSNHGTGAEIAAPGVNIRSTTPRNRYEENAGTSMASPHVAGAAALLMSLSPGIAPGEVRRRLLQGDTLNGIGTPGLNLARALAGGA